MIVFTGRDARQMAKKQRRCQFVAANPLPPPPPLSPPPFLVLPHRSLNFNKRTRSRNFRYPKELRRDTARLSSIPFSRKVSPTQTLSEIKIPLKSGCSLAGKIEITLEIELAAICRNVISICKAVGEAKGEDDITTSNINGAKKTERASARSLAEGRLTLALSSSPGLSKSNKRKVPQSDRIGATGCTRFGRSRKIRKHSVHFQCDVSTQGG